LLLHFFCGLKALHATLMNKQIQRFTKPGRIN